MYLISYNVVCTVNNFSIYLPRNYPLHRLEFVTNNKSFEVKQNTMYSVIYAFGDEIFDFIIVILVRLEIIGKPFHVPKALFCIIMCFSCIKKVINCALSFHSMMWKKKVLRI
jgi:hypothetical protein